MSFTASFGSFAVSSGVRGLHIGERLGYPEERILEGTAEELLGGNYDPLSVLLAENDAWGMDSTAYGLPDEAFDRDEVPMTKEEVRSISLSKLALGERSVVWDVGAGTGSVSVEMAMKASAGRVWAVERGSEGCHLIRQNREKFGVWNLSPVEGAAPEALADLPAPDRVFIGGSSGNLTEIIHAALEKNPDARICVSAIVLETLQEAVTAMDAAGLDPEITHVSVSTARKLGAKHMMMAGNPIYIITGERKG